MSPGSNNQRIHDMLVELGDVEKTKGDTIRASAYYKAARAVKAHTAVIDSGKAAAKALEGVGKKIGEKIDELLTTGTLSRLERERADSTTVALKDLQRVSGIGPKFAAELSATHGIHSVAALAAHTHLLNHEQARTSRRRRRRRRANNVHRPAPHYYPQPPPPRQHLVPPPSRVRPSLTAPTRAALLWPSVGALAAAGPHPPRRL